MPNCTAIVKAGVDIQKAVSAKYDWHMPDVLGTDDFWNVYKSLNDRSTIWHDLFRLAASLSLNAQGLLRAARLITDQLRDKIQKRMKML